MRKMLFALGIAMALVAVTAMSASAMRPDHADKKRVMVPDEDRFSPFAITIHAGGTVQWQNNDTDNHTVVSDDAFNTAGHQGFDMILGANGGTLKLTFTHPGTFVYYCRFHAALDAFNQPTAPGPDGGIQGSDGNFGTPMSGVITVLP